MIFGRELKTKTSDIKSGITTDSNSAALSMRLVYTYSSRPISLLLETSSFGNRGINFLYYVKAHGVKFVTKVCCPLIPTLIFHARNTTYLLRKGTFSTKFNPCYYILLTVCGSQKQHLLVRVGRGGNFGKQFMSPKGHIMGKKSRGVYTYALGMMVKKRLLRKF